MGSSSPRVTKYSERTKCFGLGNIQFQNDNKWRIGQKDSVKCDQFNVTIKLAVGLHYATVHNYLKNNVIIKGRKGI